MILRIFAVSQFIGCRMTLIGSCIESTKSGLFALAVKAGSDKAKADRIFEDIRGDLICLDIAKNGKVVFGNLSFINLET